MTKDEIEELAFLRAFHARVTAAVEYSIPVDRRSLDEAIAADARAGLSLRANAAKHGVGVGVVRGVAKRTAAIKHHLEGERS